eukprot:gnl/MRDRNA2_/MRDRNA2_94751_c0_seq1.p1 gnl/MRDRNA2_/MRDRNA2_94751_c0~~gnl/MRDRNA2_/MRDRNA2_94751_c0_seq1.p1  ORF type:complete len:372 (+),score=47.59 gnl/MRDRNA2_/MRDRNA2_94751_c0_seq1:98-1117(+)
MKRSTIWVTQARIRYDRHLHRACSSSQTPRPTPFPTTVTPVSHANATDREERSGVKGIAFKGPIDQALGMSYSSQVGKMWGNISPHIRQSFQNAKSVDDVPNTTATSIDSLVVQTKQLVASTGLAPAHWTGQIAPYYDGAIALAPYSKGQTAAYHYPRDLVPRNYAYRVPLDMYVDPVFQTSHPDQILRMKSHTLFHKLQGKATILVTFSGQPLSGITTGVQQWLDACAKETKELPDVQIAKIHFAEGWFNRRLHYLTKFHLRHQVSQSEQFTTYVYRGKWKQEYVRALHLYDQRLPSFLLVDRLGYIRWHAVGLPNEDATEVLIKVVRKVAKEGRYHM